MEQKKACMAALVKSIVGFVFLLWLLLMPLDLGDGIESMIGMHIAYARMVLSLGEGNGAGTILTVLFAAAFLIAWVIFFIQRLLGLVRVLRWLNSPEKVNLKKMKEACGFADAIMLFVLFLLAYYYLLLLSGAAFNYAAIALTLVFLVAVIVLGIRAKRLVKKAFTPALAPASEVPEAAQ